MLTELLYFMGAKQQHDGQKAQGWAGLLFLSITFVMVWKWSEWIYPVLQWSGLVGLAERVGLISEYPQATLFNVMAMIVLLAFSFALILATIFSIGFVLSIVGASNIGKTLIGLVFGIIFIVPIAIIVYKERQKLKQSLSKSANDEKQDWNEKAELDETKRIADFYATPIKPTGDLHNGREMKQFIEMASAQMQYSPDSIFKPIYSTMERVELLQRSEVMLEGDYDSLLAYDKRTGRFHFLLPNPLSAYTSELYSTSFNDEAALLEAIKRYQTSPAITETHIVPSLLMEFNAGDRSSFMLPAESAIIQPFNIANEQDFMYFNLKHNLMLELHTFPAINKREDFQNLMNQVNTNAYTLKTIIETQKIKSKQANELPTWKNMNVYEGLFAGKVLEIISNYKKMGYSWSVSND